MDSRVSSNQSWISTYNNGKTFNQLLKVLYEANRCFPSNQAPPDFFHTFADSFNITVFFNLYWETIVSICDTMVNTEACRYTLSDLMNTEWFFVKWLYDKAEKRIEEENKRRQKEADEQERRNQAQQQQQQQMYRQMMPNMPNMNY